MISRPLVTCLYPQLPGRAAAARELAESAARLGLPVQGLAYPTSGDPREDARTWPARLAEMVEAGQGPWVVLDPATRIAGPLDELLGTLAEVDLAIGYRAGQAPTRLYDPGVLLLRRTPATLEFLAAWAEESLAWSGLHRAGHGATLPTTLLAARDRLRWRAIPLPEATSAGVVAWGLCRREEPLDGTSAAGQLGAEPCGTSNDAHCVMLARQARAPGDPADELATDFREFAARWGMNQVWTLAVSGVSGERGLLADERLALWQELSRRFAPGTRLLVADAQVLLIRDPRPWAVALDAADLSLAWDASDERTWPATQVLGLRMSPLVDEWLWPRLVERYRALRETFDDGRALALAWARVLRDPECPLAVATLPAAAIARGGPLTRNALAVWADDERSWLPAEPRAVVPRPHPATAAETWEFSTLALGSGEPLEL